MRAAFVISATVLAWLAATGRARAQGTQPVRVTIVGAECTDEASFWADLTRRAPRLRPATREEPAPRLEIEVTRERGRVLGRMRVALSGQPGATRAVTGATCDEVVATLALMTALVFDAAAPELPATAPPPPPPASSPARAPELETNEPVAAAPPASIHWRWSAGPQAAAWSAGGAALSLGAFVDTERERTPATAASWSFRLGGSFAWLETSVASVESRVTWRVASLDASPWRVAIGARWSLRPYAAIEAGAIDVSASGIEDAHDVTRPWLAAGLRARLAWVPADPLALGLDAGALVPFFRDAFAVDPSVSIFRAPIAVFSGGLWIGVRFL